MAFTVQRVEVDFKEAYMSTEHFSQQPSDTFMDDGGERHGVYGLGFKRPEVMEEWNVTYSDGPRHGTVESIQYARRNGFERLIIDLCMVGRVDVVREDGVLKDGPVWSTMDLPMSAVSLRSAQDLRSIMGQISREASGLVEAVLGYK